MAKKSTSTGSAGSKKPAPAAAPATRSAAPTKTTGVRNSPVPKVAAAVAPVRKEITREMIAARAFEIYQSGTGGTELENWLRAERELKQGA